MKTIIDLNLTMAELGDRISAGIASDKALYHDKHGLKGLFVRNVGPLVVVGYVPGDALKALAAYAAYEVLKLTGDSNDTGLDDLVEQTAKAMSDDSSFTGFAAPASDFVSYTTWTFNGLPVIRFSSPRMRQFGPVGDRPKVHHLAGYAIGSEHAPRLDRHALQGAFDA